MGNDTTICAGGREMAQQARQAHHSAALKHMEVNLDTSYTYHTGCTAAAECECVLLGRIEAARRQRTVNPKYERTAPVEPRLS